MKNNTHCRIAMKGRALKRTIFIGIFLSLFSFNITAQVFWTETFHNGCSSACLASSYTGPNGTWVLNPTGANDPEANEWFISGEECGNAAGTCGSVCGSTNPSLHIGANDGFVLDAGASYDAGGLCGVLFCVTTDMRAESPIINCFGHSGITLAFNYMENGDLTNDDATLWYFDGTVWAQIDPMAKTLFGACSPQGMWTAFSIVLPASANNNPNVKIGFRWVNNDDGVGTDPSVAIDDVTLSTTTNSITTGTIVGSPFCACSAVSVPFTSTGTFTAGNIYTAQLSNAAGSFAAPTTIGTLASTLNSGTIACTIPCATPTGTGYRIRVISSAPPIVGSDNGVNITINAPPVATFSYTGTPYCQSAVNPSPTFSGGGVAGTFTSTAGLVFVSSTTGVVNLSGSTPGTYTVTNTVAAAGGCAAVTATSTITITPVQSSAFNYSSSTYCSSGINPIPTITGVAGGTFTSAPAGLVFVSTGTGQINLSGSALNTYTITYTSPGPCPSSSTATVTITTTPVATFSYTGSSYCQNAANPSPTFSGGGSAGAFTSTVGLSINSVTGVVNLLASTPGTYTVTNSIAASGGCPAATATSTITINPMQNAAFNYTGSTFCSSGANPTPIITGTAGGTFSAFPGGLVFVSTSTGQINLSGSTLGSYSVVYTTAGPCPAADTVSVTITTIPLATFSYSGSPYCQNDPNPSPTFGAGASGGTFTSTAGLSINAATGVINLLASTPGTYTVTNTIAASGGCPAATATTTITINPIPNVTVNSPTICTGQTATLTAAGATSYSWSAGATSTGVNTATASPASTTSYTVTGTSAGCTNTAVSTITVNPCNVPVANFTANQQTFCTTPACVNFTDISTNSPTSWTWLFPGGTPSFSSSQNPSNVCYSANGSYNVTLIATNANGADTLTQVGYITVGASAAVTISGNTAIDACEKTTLYASPADGTYTWGPSVNMTGGNGSSVTVSPPATQQYYVTYTSPGGCTASDTTTVDVVNIYTYFMPTGFSPNGDGINDVLLVKGRGIDYINLKIFDRIGEKVFETTDLDKGWDGKLLGLPMNDNVFVYRLEVTYCNGETVKEHGSITLVK